VLLCERWSLDKMDSKEFHVLLCVQLSGHGTMITNETLIMSGKVILVSQKHK
jgi:hypothetical protein